MVFLVDLINLNIRDFQKTESVIIINMKGGDFFVKKQQ